MAALASSSAQAPVELDWKFTQSFGEKDNTAEVTEGDMVTAVEFDHTGDFLAVGDKAGRIWLFEGHINKSLNKEPLPSAANKLKLTKPVKRFEPVEYKFYSQFQSHEPEFDCLKSLEIEEKINMIKFCPRQNRSLLMLSSNDKTIKLWKVNEKKVKRVSTMNIMRETEQSPAFQPRTAAELRIPQLLPFDTIISAAPRRVFQNAHAYHINSISVNCDGETFLSADDLRLNLWSLERSDQSFNIIDIKPPNMDELTEVITAATFHPTQCNLLMYSSSRGTIRLGDLRDRALCERYAKSFEVEEDPAQKTFFSEIVSSISDVKFTADGKYIVSRDYMTIKIWDVAMESKPVLTVPVHEYLRPKLCDLYENDCIFDKFECAASGDGQRFVTGSYADHFMIHDLATQSSMMVEASKPPPRRRPGSNSPALSAMASPATKSSASSSSASSSASSSSAKKDASSTAAPPASIPDVDAINYDKKILHVAWHPTRNAVAVAGLNNLYLYQA